MLGADVIKVESLKHPDMTRRRIASGGTVKWVISAAPTPAELSRSTYFDAVNISKKSVRINLTKAEGVDLARRLVAVSDVAVSSFRPGVMERLGLGYGELSARKPDLVMVAVSGMGSEGPESNYATYASIFAALGGVSYLTGYANGTPTEIRASMDQTVAVTAVFGVLAALCHRQRTGKGQFIDLSAQEAVAALVGDALLDYEMNGRVQERRGNRDAVAAPHGCYRCRGEQRWVAIAVRTEEEWRALRRVMGEPSWCAEERFATPLRRWHAQEDLDRHLGEWTREYEAEELMRRLQQAGVPAMPVMSSEQLFSDPHLRERGVWIALRHPELGPVHEVGLPWKFSRNSPTYAPSPLLGEHDEYVFGTLLGLHADDIAAMRERKSIF